MTIPNVFIIESLRFSDEEKNRFEGKLLSDMLHLSGSDSRYIYLRTRKELKEITCQFRDSDYRYLHLSCHGDKTSVGLTLDDLSFRELGAILKPALKGRRVFFSSCDVMNKGLATALLKGSGCHSLIGPSKSINFDRAAAFWMAFYHLMLRDNAKAMSHKKVGEVAASLRLIFGVDIRCFCRSNSEVCGFTEVQLREDRGVGRSLNRRTAYRIRKGN